MRMSLQYSNYHTVDVGHLVLNNKLEVVETFGDFRDNDPNMVEKLREFIRIYDRSYQFMSTANLKDITIQFDDYYLKIDMSKEQIWIRKYILNKQTEQA